MKFEISLDFLAWILLTVVLVCIVLDTEELDKRTVNLQQQIELLKTQNNNGK